MTDYTEPQAYKHLLQVAQNIVYSSQVDHQILHKYQQLKKSILKKISKPSSQIYYLNLLSTYRLLIENAIKTVQCFQEELQNQMERNNYNQLVIGLNQSFQTKLTQLQTSIDSTNTKTRLLHKEEINTLKYHFDQLDSKFENLGLLIQVHKKMHEIILEATKAEQKKLSIETAYKEKIKQLQNYNSQIHDAKAFIQQHKTTQEKYSDFKIASKALKKVLFSQFK